VLEYRPYKLDDVVHSCVHVDNYLIMLKTRLPARRVHPQSTGPTDRATVGGVGVAGGTFSDTVRSLLKPTSLQLSEPQWPNGIMEFRMLDIVYDKIRSIN